jgi:hypothetical protein
VTEKKRDSGGLSVQTLLISSAAAVAAAVIVPTFWERGSLIATAITPVVEALVSEGLRRPAQAMATAAPKVARRTGTGLAVRREQPTGVGARGQGPEQLPPRADEDGISPEDPFGLRAASAPRRRLPVRLAIATGLLAAVIGAGVVTAAELGLGHSFTSPKHETSLWGGKTAKGRKAKETATPTPTPTAGSTAQPTATATPSASPTPSATPSATPTPSVGATPNAAPTATPSG